MTLRDVEAAAATSTTLILRAGLKKWTPANERRWSMPSDSRSSERLEVLLTKTERASRKWSTVASNFLLTPRSSTTVSTIQGQQATRSADSVNSVCSRIRTASSREIMPRAVYASTRRPHASDAMYAEARCQINTLYPWRAKRTARSHPMVPLPRIATDSFILFSQAQSISRGPNPKPTRHRNPPYTPTARDVCAPTERPRPKQWGWRPRKYWPSDQSLYEYALWADRGHPYPSG